MQGEFGEWWVGFGGARDLRPAKELLRSEDANIDRYVTRARRLRHSWLLRRRKARASGFWQERQIRTRCKKSLFGSGFARLGEWIQSQGQLEVEPWRVAFNNKSHTPSSPFPSPPPDSPCTPLPGSCSTPGSGRSGDRRRRIFHRRGRPFAQQAAGDQIQA